METKIKRNKKTVTGGDKYIATDEISRIFINLPKNKMKELKKAAIDLEMPVDDVLPLALDLLIHRLKSIDLKEIEKNGVDALFGTNKS